MSGLRRLRTAVTATAAIGLAAVGAAAPPALAALPTVTVRVTTSPPLTNGAHTGVTVTAGCASGRLVSGGGFLRLIDPVNGGNAPGPGLPRVPTNGLVLGGSVPSTGAAAVDAGVADGAVDPSTWLAISNFTGQAELGDQASAFAMCATGGPSHTVVKTASRIGANAPQATTSATDTNLMGAAPPIVTTATCPEGNRLVGGGAMTTTPDTVNNGTTPGNNQNLKPLASYPSDSAGAMLPDGSTAATSWSGYGSSGNSTGNPTDTVIVFAVCSTDAATPPVQVARADATGPLAQPARPCSPRRSPARRARGCSAAATGSTRRSARSRGCSRSRGCTCAARTRPPVPASIPTTRASRPPTGRRTRRRGRRSASSAGSSSGRRSGWSSTASRSAPRPR